jgi:hypothetical protein
MIHAQAALRAAAAPPAGTPGRSTTVSLEPLTPAFVQEYLRWMAQIDVSIEEAAAIIPNIEANRAMLAALDRFDLQEVRPGATYNPA